MKIKYVHMGNKYNPETFMKVKNKSIESRFNNKPIGGFWACRYTPEAEYRCAWEEWADYEDFAHYGKSDVFMFTLKEYAKVLKIASSEEYMSISDRYKDRLGLINWEALAEDYDAFELTKMIHSNKSPLNTFERWDVPSIIILNKDIIVPD